MEISGVLSHPRLDFMPSRENKSLWSLFDENATTQTEGCWHISATSSFLNTLHIPVTVTDTSQAAREMAWKENLVQLGNF